MEKINVKQLFWMLWTIVLMGFGIALFKYANYGNDPFTGMCFAIVEKFGITLGVTECVVNVFLFALQLALLRHKVNWGTLVNAFALGYIIDFWLGLQRAALGAQPATPMRLICCLAALIITSLACSLYYTVDMGIAPYDASSFILERFTPMPFAVCRMITDGICVIVCFVLGGVIGIGTLASALCMGPIIAWFKVHVAQKVVPQF